MVCRGGFYTYLYIFLFTGILGTSEKQDMIHHRLLNSAVGVTFVVSI